MSDTVPVENTVATPLKPRRRWFRFLHQFSLRTMLIGMTLAAVACWWFLQPGVQEEELAGRYLKLRRQIRVTRAESKDTGGETIPAELVSVGSWQLRDDNQDLLVDGRYHNDLPHGKWTLWYPSDRKAVEGEAFRGAKSGLWRVWDEQGTLRSEVTYRAVTRPKQVTWNRAAAPRAWRGGGAGFMLIGGPLGQFPPPRMNPSFPQLPESHVAERHGPCRVWYASGKLQYEGSYAADRRDGAWTFYDEQGNVTEAGEYKADLREGEWTIRQSSPHAPREGTVSRSETTTMVAGRTEAEHDALLARLRADLASNSIRRQVAAAARLEELGQHALPILHDQLQSGSTEAKILALRILTERDALSPAMYPQIEPLIGDDDPRLVLRAMLAVYLLSPERRGQIHRRLLDLVEATDNRDLKLDVLAKMCDANSDQQLATFMELLEILAQDYDPSQVNAYPPLELEWPKRIKFDPIPPLAQSFVHSDPRVRLYILLVLEQLVETGEGQLPAASGTAGNAEITWPIPPTVQAVIDKAKTDPDPTIRETAEAIGREQQFFGAGGGFF